MPVKAVKRGDKYRVIESGTRRIARGPQGKPADGGGHKDASKAARQAVAINTPKEEKRKKR